MWRFRRHEHIRPFKRSMSPGSHLSSGFPLSLPFPRATNRRRTRGWREARQRFSFAAAEESRNRIELWRVVWIAFSYYNRRKGTTTRGGRELIIRKTRHARKVTVSHPSIETSRRSRARKRKVEEETHPRLRKRSSSGGHRPPLAEGMRSVITLADSSAV